MASGSDRPAQLGVQRLDGVRGVHDPPHALRETGSGIAEIAAVINNLRLSSDFAAFLGAGVPIRLHRQAMFKLWRLDPLFGRLDGLSVYDEDFRTLTHSLEM